MLNKSKNMNSQKGALAADIPGVNFSAGVLDSKRHCTPNQHLGLDEAGRDPTNLLHWVPVPFPGLCIQQLLAVMEAIDRKPYATPHWLATPRSIAIPAFLEGGRADTDRDPNNALDWMPVPPPAGFSLAVAGESSANINFH